MRFTDQLKKLGYKSYKEYLTSPHWILVRGNYHASGKPRCCYVCSKERFELHHRTYARLGRERLSDLVPLCPTCHNRVHKLVRYGLAHLLDAHILLKESSSQDKSTSTSNYSSPSSKPSQDSSADTKSKPTKPKRKRIFTIPRRYLPIGYNRKAVGKRLKKKPKKRKQPPEKLD